MTNEEILRAIASLPPEGQRQVADFIAFLHERYGRTPHAASPSDSDLRSEAFVGMWQDRDDMPDGGEWVRNLRESEWVK